MQRLSTIAVAIAAATTLSAQAEVIDAKFSGTVATETHTAFSVGTAITGEFRYDTVSAVYLSFSIGGRSIAPGYASSASITPDLFSAIYQAQLSPVMQGGSLNSTFSVDLEGLNAWPSNDAVALLANPGALATNLDTSLSSFGFYIANVDGSHVRALGATLTGIQASVVPEPGSALLMLAGIAAIGWCRIRRAKG